MPRAGRVPQPALRCAPASYELPSEVCAARSHLACAWQQPRGATWARWRPCGAPPHVAPLRACCCWPTPAAQPRRCVWRRLLIQRAPGLPALWPCQHWAPGCCVPCRLPPQLFYDPGGRLATGIKDWLDIVSPCFGRDSGLPPLYISGLIKAGWASGRHAVVTESIACHAAVCPTLDCRRADWQVVDAAQAPAQRAARARRVWGRPGARALCHLAGVWQHPNSPGAPAGRQLAHASCSLRSSCRLAPAWRLGWLEA